MAGPNPSLPLLVRKRREGRVVDRIGLGIGCGRDTLRQGEDYVAHAIHMTIYSRA